MHVHVNGRLRHSGSAPTKITEHKRRIRPLYPGPVLGGVVVEVYLHVPERCTVGLMASRYSTLQPHGPALFGATPGSAPGPCVLFIVTNLRRHV